MTDNISKLPRWARDKIASLEADLRRWQDLYVELSTSMSKRDPIPIPAVSPPMNPATPPHVTWPSFEINPDFPPGVYAYMSPFPSKDSTTIGTAGTVWMGVTRSPPTGGEP